jgi:transposase
MRSPKRQLPSVARRLFAGQMLLAGDTVECVAARLRISKATAKRYKSMVEQGGIEALDRMEVGAGESALDNDAREWLARSLRGSPHDFKFDTDQWTTSLLMTVIQDRFGLTFSRVYVWQLIHDLGCADRLISKSRLDVRPTWG